MLACCGLTRQPPCKGACSLLAHLSQFFYGLLPGCQWGSGGGRGACWLKERAACKVASPALSGLLGAAQPCSPSPPHPHSHHKPPPPPTPSPTRRLDIGLDLPPPAAVLRRSQPQLYDMGPLIPQVHNPQAANPHLQRAFLRSPGGGSRPPTQVSARDAVHVGGGARSCKVLCVCAGRPAARAPCKAGGGGGGGQPPVK